jgi:methionyl-tRNA formyltransferase
MRVIFFCGHKSRYGRCHLKPILDTDFNITKVVLATPSRWRTFRNALQGESYDAGSEAQHSVWELLKRVPKSLSFRAKRLFQQRHSAEKRFLDLLDEHGLHYEFADDVNSHAAVESWKDSEPHLIISAAYPQIFHERLLRVPSADAVNFHPSVLPKFRGAHPHFWAIREGAQETGVTAHRMTPELDAGQIIARQSFSCENLWYSELYDRIVSETPGLVEQVAGFYLEDSGQVVNQNDDEATYFRNNRRLHSRIFWDDYSADQIFNIIRTETAFFFLSGRKVWVTDADISSECGNVTNRISPPPGTIVEITERSVVIIARNGYVRLRETRTGSKSYSPLELAKAFTLNVGQRLH